MRGWKSERDGESSCGSVWVGRCREEMGEQGSKGLVVRRWERRWETGDDGCSTNHIGPLNVRVCGKVCGKCGEKIFSCGKLCGKLFSWKTG